MNLQIDAENARRAAKNWPSRSMIAKGLTFRACKLSVPYGSAAEPSTRNVPYCPTCRHGFFSESPAEPISRHFASRNHLKTQLSHVDGKHKPSTLNRSVAGAHLQNISRLKAAAFMGDHASLSFQIGGNLLEFASRVFEPLGDLITTTVNEIKIKAKNVKLQSLAPLQNAYKVISEAALGAAALGKEYTQLANFRLHETHARMCTAITPISVGPDASTAVTARSHEVMCGSYVDAEFNYSVDMIDSFDVTAKGASTGEALYSKEKSIEQEAGLDVDHRCVDGASNVCEFTGRAKSLCARFINENPHATTDWCKCHMMNLCNGDVIKLLNIVRPTTIRTLRQSKSFLSRSGANLRGLADLLEESKLDLQSLMRACDHLERHILDTPPPHTKEDCLQVNNLVQELKEKKISAEDFEKNLHNLGKRNALAGYIVVRWYSLFNSATSLNKMYPFLTKYLTNIISADDDSAGREDETSTGTDDVTWQKKNMTRKEKARVLLQGLKSERIMFAFLSDLGFLFKVPLQLLQTQLKPINHRVFPVLLRFQQTLFNAALDFTDDPSKSLAARQEFIVKGRGRTAAAQRYLDAMKTSTVAVSATESPPVGNDTAPEVEDNALWCYCQTVHDESKEYIGCDFEDQCTGVQWYHLYCLPRQERAEAYRIIQANKSDVRQTATWFCPSCKENMSDSQLEQKRTQVLRVFCSIVL